ncbi:hypothetical protein J4Q44_G00089450 [Coregonus suidteri]|uniref:Uncharacterized protein n=1 Tax=Coregonus suidteri TaxID=861788 RepID=A0AAN8LYE7_9TELE
MSMSSFEERLCKLVFEGGGVLDSPATELSPVGPSTGGSSPLSPAWFITSPALLTNTQRIVQAHPCYASSRRTLALCPATPSTTISQTQLQWPEDVDC